MQGLLDEARELINHSTSKCGQSVALWMLGTSQVYLLYYFTSTKVQILTLMALWMLAAKLELCTSDEC
jgi:hypothetical protein